MAIVHAIGAPDTETERTAIHFLSQRLPDTYTILHNMEIPNRAGFPYEIDMVVIAPHAVYIIEEKGYVGRIVGNPHQWRLSSGVVVPSPIPRLNKKTRIVGGHVKAGDRALQDVFFEAIVLLTDPRARLSLRDRQAHRVVPLANLPEVVADPTRLPVTPRPIGERLPRLFEALTARAAPLVRRKQLGVYRIIETVGATSEYTEYLAEHQYLRTEPRARLKVYHFDAYQTPDGRRRQIELIMRDINALRCLAGHPNIARAADVFPWGSSAFVVATEWIDGDTLRARLDGAPLDEAEVITLARQLARGLAHAHNHGVIHRDLRPENIAIAQDGFIKLTNFDCARVTVPAADTIAGQVSAFWDERYVAPEVLLAPQRASGRSDLYSLGVVLFESLTGELPYADVTELLHASAFTRHPSRVRRGINPAWDQLILRLCHFEWDHRYPNANVFLADLDDMERTKKPWDRPDRSSG